MRCRTVNMIERHIKGGQKTIMFLGLFLAYVGRNQLGLSMDIETKVVQNVFKSQGIEHDNLTTINITHLFHL